MLLITMMEGQGANAIFKVLRVLLVLVILAALYYGFMIWTGGAKVWFKTPPVAVHLDSAGAITSSSIYSPVIENSEPISLGASPEWLKSIITLNAQTSSIKVLQKNFYSDGAAGYRVELETKEGIKENFATYFNYVSGSPGLNMVINGLADKSFIIEFQGEGGRVKITQGQDNIILIQTLNQ